LHLWIKQSSDFDTGSANTPGPNSKSKGTSKLPTKHQINRTAIRGKKYDNIDTDTIENKANSDEEYDDKTAGEAELEAIICKARTMKVEVQIEKLSLSNILSTENDSDEDINNFISDDKSNFINSDHHSCDKKLRNEKKNSSTITDLEVGSIMKKVNVKLTRISEEDLIKNNCNQTFHHQHKDSEILKCNLKRNKKHVKTQRRVDLHLCKICNKSFSQKKNLTSHIRTHSGDKPYICEFCKKSFTTKYNLNHHRRVHHTGENVNKCNICKKLFGHKIYLQRHKRIHTGEKPFKCTHCRKSFAHKGNLNTHVRDHHFGEKRFKCLVCNKSFTRNEKLKKHRKTHTGCPTNIM